MFTVCDICEPDGISEQISSFPVFLKEKDAWLFWLNTSTVDGLQVSAAHI